MSENQLLMRLSGGRQGKKICFDHLSDDLVHYFLLLNPNSKC